MMSILLHALYEEYKEEIEKFREYSGIQQTEKVEVGLEKLKKNALKRGKTGFRNKKRIKTFLWI